ncbi:hypothetical protein JCM19314_3707 [Nonlabens ulvanivorans]|uniref:Uncharacterized protein n=2 Tax=Nonlabens ulvanivorans TaxID=906888 RepID=A0A090QBR1_NONUL|nr:hypothetical protein JCM19314_3707 [Nonlabens ulvanivorans]
MDNQSYENLITHYTNHMEVLVQVLRVVIAILSTLFVITILKGGTYYKKWMAIFNPIVILAVVFSTMFFAKDVAKHLVPIAMNVTHFILFTLSLYQLKKYSKNQLHA